MNNNINVYINHILSLLTDEQKNKEIVELENTPNNKIIFEYLNKIGAFGFKYKIEQEKRFRFLREEGGSLKLWYRDINGIWIIKLWVLKLIKSKEV